MLLLSFFAFLSGIVTIASPCILPVLPIVLSGSIGGKRKPLGVVTGFILSFSVFTLALSALIQILGISADALRVAAIVIIVAFGSVLVIPFLQLRFETFVSRMVSGQKTSRSEGYFGGVLIGSSLGMVWTPCVGPIMASVITLAISQQVDGGAVLIVLAYSLGASIPMFAIMIGGRKLLQRFPKLTSRTAAVQKFFGYLMIAVGISLAFGIDRRFQTLVLKAFPAYGSGLTAIESLGPVQEALQSRRERARADSDGGDSAGGTLKPDWRTPPKNGRLADYGPAPEFPIGSAWLNGRALTLAELKGKVVLVDFWTYSCINCVRTLPYVRTWHERYTDQGLVIIGVHSPEFPFERNVNNLAQAMKDLNVTWPVVQDNDFSLWNAYGNQYWPAHYFIDSRGRIRYYHFGEGSYDTSERVIQALLAEAGADVEAVPRNAPAPLNEAATAETYLGYERAQGFVPSGRMAKDELERYAFSRRPERGEWQLEGDWIIRGKFIESRGETGLRLGYEAKNVYLVIEPLDTGASARVSVDGTVSPDTADVVSGMLSPAESRLYHLVEMGSSGTHLLELRITGAVRLYAFTFG